VAATLPSREKAAPTPHSRVTLLPSRQRRLGLPPAAGTLANAESPSSCRPTRISSGRSQDRLAAEPRMPGVRLRAGPPVTGRTKTSPPFEPASLIRPSMKATREPSGLKVGSQICSAGLCSTRSAPEATSKRWSWAIHQLSSPEPGAALAAIVRPSGLMAYS
jgi:hypothetical protein